MEGYGKRILVVDDEEHIRVLLCLLLEQDGYNVHTAIDGEEALDEMMKRRFDIVLTDFDMPRRNGLGVLSFGRHLSWRADSSDVGSSGDRGCCERARCIRLYPKAF